MAIFFPSISLSNFFNFAFSNYLSPLKFFYKMQNFHCSLFCIFEICYIYFNCFIIFFIISCSFLKFISFYNIISNFFLINNFIILYAFSSYTFISRS